MARSGWFLVAFLLCSSRPTWAADCSAHWEVFDHRPYSGTLLPDTNVRYWRLRFATDQPNLALRLAGSIPGGRYQAVTVYDQTTWNAVDHSGPDPQTPLTIAPVGTRGALHFPTAVAGRVEAEVWVRVYLPDEPDPLMPPPIAAYDIATGEPLPCPPVQRTTPDLLDLVGRLPPSSRTDLAFYRPQPRGIYANPDNAYLMARLAMGFTSVAVFRLRAPLVGVGEVRYWSICLSGMTTITAGCVADVATTRSQPVFAVGPGWLKDRAEELGIHYLDRGILAGPLVLYRQVVAGDGFAGDVRRVPPIPEQAEVPQDYVAEEFIGDYAPQGVVCRGGDFVRDGCGFAPPAP